MDVIKFLGAKRIIILLIALCLGILALQNMDFISLRFLFWDLATIRKIYVIIGSALLGFIAGIVFGWKAKR